MHTKNNNNIKKKLTNYKKIIIIKIFLFIKQNINK